MDVNHNWWHCVRNGRGGQTPFKGSTSEVKEPTDWRNNFAELKSYNYSVNIDASAVAKKINLGVETYDDENECSFGSRRKKYIDYLERDYFLCSDVYNFSSLIWIHFYGLGTLFSLMILGKFRES